MILRSIKRRSIPLLFAPGANLFSAESKVGGQAIIEGVMMRGKEKVGWAVKRGDGEVEIEKFPFISLAKKSRFWGLPVMRGAVYLIESFYLGYKALNRSAELAYPEENKTGKRNAAAESAISIASLIAVLGITVGVFLYLPMMIMSWLGYAKSALTFNLGVGFMRIVFFLAYLAAISLWKDVRRLFEYHGAEHKAIFAFEDGKELTIDNMRPYTTFHPRCGTSFILMVSIVCILLFSCIDAVLMATVFTSGYTVPVRLLVHVLLIPLVSGTSYEALKLSDRFQHVPPVSWLIQPGLWLQRITTKNPDDSQLGIAAAALKSVL
jgi:uncharacterized protein YqhQ